MSSLGRSHIDHSTDGSHTRKAILRREGDPDSDFIERGPRARPITGQKPQNIEVLSRGDSFAEECGAQRTGIVLAKAYQHGRLRVLVAFEGSAERAWTWVSASLRVVPR